MWAWNVKFFVHLEFEYPSDSSVDAGEGSEEEDEGHCEEDDEFYFDALFVEVVDLEGVGGYR